MPSEHDKAKRFRLRFSIRTLAIVVTLACCYAACWGPTKTRGLVVVHKREFGLASDNYFISDGFTSARLPLVIVSRHRYYFWFFGYVAKLPYEREVNFQLPTVSAIPSAPSRRQISETAERHTDGVP